MPANPWLATIGSVLPGAITWGRRPAEAPASRDQELAEPVAAPTAMPTPHPDDPPYLRVVPFVPPSGVPEHQRVHPRIRNPFRLFPRRGVDIVDLMFLSDPRD